jgi:Dak1 domain
VTDVFNDPVSFKDEMLEGFLSAYGRYVERVPGASGVMRAGGPREGKVSVIIGGGSGHYPAFCGVVGVGLADGAVMGDIFASPSTEQAYRVGKALDGGAGILFSYGNKSACAPRGSTAGLSWSRTTSRRPRPVTRADAAGSQVTCRCSRPRRRRAIGGRASTTWSASP